MSFIELQQAGIAGAQKIFVNVESIAYVQEVHPELGLMWSSPAGPSRALVHLTGVAAPLAVLDAPEEVVARVARALETPASPPPRAGRKPAGKKTADA